MGKEGSAPASPSPPAFSLISFAFGKGRIREFCFGLEKRNHLAVGEKNNQELFCAGSSLARQHELKGLLSPR